MNEKQIIQEEKSELFKKFIDIRTIRIPNKGEVDYIDLLGISSIISFSDPIRDFRGDLNKKLYLKTLYCRSASDSANYWLIGLDNERGYNILGNSFGHLSGPLSDYSGRKLRKWQENAITNHKMILECIENHYWQGEEIPEGIFSNIG